MNGKRLIKRREFLKLSSAAVVAGLTGRLTGKKPLAKLEACPAGSWAIAGGRSQF